MPLKIPVHIEVNFDSRNLIKSLGRKKDMPLIYFLTYLLTHSKEHSPSWEASWFSASQEFPYILLNPNVHSHIHTCPLPLPNLIHLNPGHDPTSHFLKIHLNNIVPSTIGSPKWNFSLCFPHWKTVCISSVNLHATCPAKCIFLDLINRNSWVENTVH